MGSFLKKRGVITFGLVIELSLLCHLVRGLLTHLQHGSLSAVIKHHQKIIITNKQGFPAFYSGLHSSQFLSSSTILESTAGSTANEPSKAQKGAAIIWCEGLSNTFDGERFQFRGIDLGIHKGEKLGLIGLNGAGKSSLLKAFAGELKPDEGKIDSVKNARVVYVKQEPKFEQGKTVKEAVFESDIPVMVALRKYYELSARLESGDTDPSTQKAFEKATEKVESLRGWEVEATVATILSKLNVYHLMDQKVDGLSGGELKRLALGIGLVEKPDVLLLDEPTNHLDVEAIEWVEDLVRANKDMACLVVTHDRLFLENVADEIVELDRAQLYRYPGAYNKYLEARAARLATEDAEHASLRNKLRRELEWVRRQPQGRQAKSKSRVEAYEKMTEKAKSRELNGSGVKLESQKQRLGNMIMQFKGANLQFQDGKTILKDFTYEFSKNDRIGIVGGNGVGKTTFLNVLTQTQSLDSGEALVGETVAFGYYNQKGLEAGPIDTSKRVIEFVQEIVENNRLETDKENPQSTTRKYLEKFQFPRNRWQERVEALSGGERRRLQLLSVLCKNPNFLVLDEPTNDLDLQTLGALEEFLTTEYQGCVILVSHDRLFMDRVTDHLFVFEGDGVVRDYVGSFTGYLEEKKADEEALYLDSSKSETTKQSSLQQTTSHTVSDEAVEEKKQLSYKERKEYKGLEENIEKLSKKQIELEAELEKAGEDGKGYSELMEIQARLDAVVAEVAEKEERWLELAEIAGDA